MNKKLMDKKILYISIFVAMLVVVVAHILNVMLVKPSVEQRKEEYGDTYFEDTASGYENKVTDSGLMYYVFNDENGAPFILICGYKGENEKVIIPEVIDDCPVEVIDQNSFIHNKTIVEVEVPVSVKLIDSWAFAGCTNLRKVIVHNENVEFGSFIHLDTQLKLYSYAGSTSEKYAEENGIGFEVLDE